MADKIKAVIREVGKITAAVGGRDTTPAKWRGKWQPEERYGVLHKVEHLGSSYVCIKACVGVDPEADVTLGDGVEGQYWILIAKCGEDGAPFTYDMFTQEQLEALRGPEGPQGVQGIQGIPGERGAQGVQGIQGIQGERGAQGERGERGAAFTYDMFTQEQLEGLRGPEGPRGYSPTVNATPTSAGVQLTIKNYDEASGMETITYANVKNGNPGLPGSPGAAGAKGDSCNIQAEETDEGVELTITNTAYTNSGASNNVQKVLVKNGEGGAPEVFVATYGETLYEDIMAAHDAGKLCVCNYEGSWHFGTVFTSTIRFTAAVAGHAVRVVTVTGFDVWEASTQTLVKKDGDSMTGYLTLHADPTEAMHAATKQYVDKKLEENVDLMGGVAPEWNDVKNKPFDENGVIKPEALPEGYPYKEGSKTVIEWDGNTEGKFLFGSATSGACKVSDKTFDNLSGTHITFMWGDESEELTLSEGVEAMSNVYMYATSAAQTTVLVVLGENAQNLETGTYFFVGSEYGYAKYVSKLTVSTETIHTMASEYLKLGNGLTVDENGAIALSLPNAEGGSF
jgi:hypothetical protein